MKGVDAETHIRNKRRLWRNETYRRLGAIQGIPKEYLPWPSEF